MSQVPRDENYNHFNVEAAGEIEIGSGIHSMTGRAVGFHFGVSWGRYGYAGGILGRSEAKRLAEYILEQLNKENITETEEEEAERRYAQYQVTSGK